MQQKLIQQSNQLSMKDKKFLKLTIYQTINHRNVNQLNQLITSKLNNQLKNHKFIKKYSNSHQIIINNLSKLIIKLNHLQKGIAFFCHLNFKKLNRVENNFSIKQKYLCHLKFKPFSKIIFNKKYDLSQLNWINNKQLKTAIFHINRQSIKLYKYEKNDLKFVGKAKNLAIKKQQKHGLKKYSPTDQDKTYYGLGADKTDRKRKKQEQLFLLMLYQAIQDYKKILKQYDQLYIIYSTSFVPLMNNYKAKLKQKLNNKINIIFKRKNFQNPNQIKKFINLQIQQINNTRQELKILMKQNQKHIALKWKTILLAQRKQQIANLMIKPNLKKMGFIRHNNLYRYPVKNSKKIKNLVPWLTTSVIQNQGHISMFKPNSQTSKAAILRY